MSSGSILLLAALSITTNCAVLDGAVEGFVTNASTQAYRVDGQVRFAFTRAGSISRPELAVPGAGVVAPGQTARVARAVLPFRLDPGEACTFQLGNAMTR